MTNLKFRCRCLRIQREIERELNNDKTATQNFDKRQQEAIIVCVWPGQKTTYPEDEVLVWNKDPKRLYGNYLKLR